MQQFATLVDYRNRQLCPSWPNLVLGECANCATQPAARKTPRQGKLADWRFLTSADWDIRGLGEGELGTEEAEARQRRRGVHFAGGRPRWVDAVLE